MYFLDANKPAALQQYLQKQGWLSPEENNVTFSKPGEGNMNYVLRIHTGSRSFIIKQARPFVEKYPQIAAPIERTMVEATFYNTIQQHDYLKNATPLLRGTDAANSVIALQDFGTATDFSFLYQLQKKLTTQEAADAAQFISVLHNLPHTAAHPLLANHAMRQLNHQHIFIFPFLQNNGFDLDTIQPGLQQAALPYKNNTALKDKIEALIPHYLNSGPCLLHGDYYPGSWLQTSDGFKIIDPEFCFMGPAAFDLGVMLAHCHLTNQPQHIMDTIYNQYKKPPHFNDDLLQKWMGVEILRRLIGLAQLPLAAPLSYKEQLMIKAESMIME